MSFTYGSEWELCRSMENPNFLQNGFMRLPPGFRFHPTDEELVVHYLRRKVYSCPLPASIIPDVDLGKFDPWDLPGVHENERYFFNRREAKYLNGSRRNRATSSGYWKATGREKPVVAAARSNRVVGMKKVLVFYKGKPPHGTKTDWIMHEYCLASDGEAKSLSHSGVAPSGDWVICRIFLKRRAAKIMDDESRSTGLINFFGRGTSSPSPSVSSCVTEVPSDDENGCSSTPSA